jgi:hypothetical protein
MAFVCTELDTGIAGAADLYISDGEERKRGVEELIWFKYIILTFG